MEKPLVSVVVAVYNTEKYLDRCVQSVLAQTYENWELILVDDGSTDGCPAMCDSYAGKDPRIRAIHQPNSGVSVVRNRGIQDHKGEYLTFLDSDDLLTPTALQEMIDVAMSQNADIVEADFLRFFTEEECATAIQSSKDASGTCTAYTAKEFLAALIVEKKMHQLVCGKLFHNSVLIIPFPEGKYVEDEYWTFRTIDTAKKIVLIEKPFYLYYFRTDSTMNVRYSKRRIDGFFAICERHEYIEQKYPDLCAISARSLYGAGMFHYQMLLAHKDVDADGAFRKAIRAKIRTLPYHLWKKNLPLKQRVWQSAFRLCPEFIGRVRNLFKIGW